MDILQQTFVIPGTLAANHVFSFVTPCDLSIIHASASNSSANAGTLKIGKATDDDAYLTAKAFGVSSAASQASAPADFAGADAAGVYPHIPKGTTVLVTITDHASHMANACVVLTCTQG